MARNYSAVLPHEEISPAQEEFLHPEMDARFTNLDEEDGTPFLRKQKRVPVRRSPLPKRTTNVLKWFSLAFVVLALLGVAYAGIYRYGERSWRFRVDSSDQIEIAGAENVTRAQVMDVMGSDLGRNIYFVPLDERRAQLEQIPWVESASVMRFVPNRLKVEVHERTPVAFVRIGSHISLIDNTGRIMEIPPHNHTQYSFPVISGTRDSDPLSTRAVRMKTFNELVRELDSEGGHYSSELSEVDLSDPEDTKVLANDPSGDVLLHLGSSSSGSGNYLDRFKLYHAHVAEWRRQFEKLDSVDLRYERQIVVNPDLRSPEKLEQFPPRASNAVFVAGVPAIAVTAARIVKRQEDVAKAANPKQAASKPVVAKPVPANKLATSATAKQLVKAALKNPVPNPKPAAVHSQAKPQQKPLPKPHKAQAIKKPAHKPVHSTSKKLSRKPSKHIAKTHAAKSRSTKEHSGAKNLKPAALKASTKLALAPAPPHQAQIPKRVPSTSGKPHAAIPKPVVNQ